MYAYVAAMSESEITFILHAQCWDGDVKTGRRNGLLCGELLTRQWASWYAALTFTHMARVQLPAFSGIQYGISSRCYCSFFYVQPSQFSQQLKDLLNYKWIT